MAVDERRAEPGAGGAMDRIVTVGFVVALLIPAIAGLLGVRPEALEARDAATLPEITAENALDAKTYAGVDRALADGFAFRSGAVRIAAMLDYDLLGGSTNPDVIVGEGDWLFASQERDPTCRLTPDAWLARWDEAVATAEAAGMDLRFLFVPDKHTVYPDKVRPGTGLGTACTDAQRAAMRLGLAARPGSTIDVLDALVAGRDEGPGPTYFTQDTHWTPFGSILAIERLVTSLDPGVWKPDEVTLGPPVARETDLSRLMGLPATETLDGLQVRPGVEVEASTVPTDVDLDAAAAIDRFRVPPDVPAIEGTTLIVYDSYFRVDQRNVRPWFRDSIWVHYNDLLYHPEIAEDLPPIDHVVLERVERFTYSQDPAALLGPVLAR